MSENNEGRARPHLIECDDGSILVEWLSDPNGRVALSLEVDPRESGWYFVSKDGDHESEEMRKMDLEKFKAALRKIGALT